MDYGYEVETCDGNLNGRRVCWGCSATQAGQFSGGSGRISSIHPEPIMPSTGSFQNTTNFGQANSFKGLKGSSTIQTFNGQSQFNGFNGFKGSRR